MIKERDTGRTRLPRREQRVVAALEQMAAHGASRGLRAEPLLRSPRLDGDVRAFCAARRIVYQGLLAAHRQPRGAARSVGGGDRRAHAGDAGAGRVPIRPGDRMLPLTGTTDAST